MFKFGVHMLIWTEHFAEKDLPLIAKAKSLGFEVFQIKLSRLDSFPAKQIKREAAETGIEIVVSGGVSREQNLIDPEPAVRKRGVEALKQQVDIANEVGSKMLCGPMYTNWGYLSGRPRTEEEWDWSVNAMREVARYAQSTGDLVLALEVLNRFETHFLNIAADAVKYCDAVGTDNVKVQLDTFHMIREESNFSEAIKACGKKYLAFFHACENNRGIPGTGLVPWKEVFTALKEIGYSGSLVIESFSPDFEDYNRLCAIWRRFADTGEELAVKGLKNLQEIERSLG